MKGVIEKIYRVMCASPTLACTRRIEIVEETNIHWATQAIRRAGWGTRRGLWYCPSCKKEVKYDSTKAT